MTNPTVVSIHVAPGAGQPLTEVQETRAVPGKGLQGDRYFDKKGTYSERPGTGREVTLIEAEAIAAAKTDYAIELAPGSHRRNIVTRGVALNHLVGREFTVGGARLKGTRLCEPCTYLEEKLAIPRSKLSLVHRGGLRCDVVSEGAIKVGDAVKVE
jgi:MOSC domain-containing protein YiiM